MIVREIVERPTSTPAPPLPPKPPTHKTGFPLPKRRPVRQTPPPQPSSSSSSRPTAASSFGEAVPHINFQHPFPDRLSEAEEIRRQTEQENVARVAAMSEQEREEEKAELLERFGPGLMEIMRKRKEKREQHQAQSQDEAGPSRLQGEKEDAKAAPALLKEPEPDSLDELKTKYFPNVPSEPAKMAWMKASSSGSSADNAARFNLSGKLLSAEEMASIPISAGLHHHGSSPDLAGYTIDEVFMLCRSTVPSQRVTMLGVLGHILASYYDGSVEVRKVVDDAQARHKAVELAVDALITSRSLNLLRAGVDVLYEALGGRTWTFGSKVYSPDPLSELVPVYDLLEPIKTVLDRDNGLRNSPTIVRVLLILRRAVRYSPEIAQDVLPLLPTIITQCIKAPPWPLEENDQPYLDALRLIDDVVSISRASAETVLNSDLPNILLRFLVVPSTPDCIALAAEALHIFTSFGRYGLAASFATTAIDLFRSLGQFVKINRSPLTAAYFDLLATWTTCAIDPHKTTPEHALTWAQVSAMGWAEEALEALQTQAAAPLGLLAAWVTGISINDADAVESKRELASEIRNRTATADVDMQPDVNTNLLRLESLLFPESILGTEMHTRLLDQQGADAQHRYHALCLRIQSDASYDLVEDAFHNMPVFLPGDEPEALDLVDQLLRYDYAPHAEFAQALNGITHPDRLQILRPLLHYAILPSASAVVGPSISNHLYLKATTSLFQQPQSTLKRSPGLPLPSDWVFSPINELLDSSSSPAFAQAPPDWDPSEIDIVRATLLLARVSRRATPISRSGISFNLMKVFMLEHNTQSSGDHPEAFRDESVVSSLRYLRGYPAVSNTQETETMESYAKSFFGPETPFFQFYTDFVALYEAISFSDPMFSALVLPPLSMLYPTDFRKLLWVDHPTALRSIRSDIYDVPCEHGSLKPFFSPAERDADVLAGYARALINGWVSERTEFLFRVAKWHLASTFWNDDAAEEVRKGLMRAIVATAPKEVIKQVLLLDLDTNRDPKQLGTGIIGDEEKERRLDQVAQVLGDRALAKARHVLEQL